MFLQDPSLSEIDISPREFLKRVEQTVKHKNFSPHSPEPRQFDNDKSSLYTNNRNPPHDFAPRRMESHESFYPREIAESINAP
jgi:hypothetical protein